MKPLKQSFELIRRKLALLLSAAIERLNPESESENPNQNVTAAGERKPAKDKTGNRLPVTRTIVEIPDAILEEYRADKKQNDRDNRKTRNIAIFAVIGAWIAALVAGIQSYEMIKTTKANELAANAAAAATAAWIIFEAAEYRGMTGNRAIFYVALKNVGKTPALDASTGWEVTVLPMDKWPTYKDWACPEKTSSPAIVPVEFPWKNDIGRPLNQLQMKMLASKIGRIFLHGCATYRDVLTKRERITELAFFYPLDTWEDQRMGIYPPYNRMK
jgi:hypothetical protein